MARLVFLLVTLMIIILALYPNLKLPDYLLLGQHADFLYHVIGFFVLTAAAAVAMNKFAPTVAAIAALAIGLEMLQALVPGREVFLSDLVASLLGVTLSALFAPFAMQVWRRCARTAWLQSRP
ncbi:MAG: hypothetical protein HC869_23880 [Rhodospirillales bacterium]|nr:hypothetical protein [Rhodospirillales bacterium]